MALSESVKESLNDAEAALRNALSFAARHERPVVCNGISDLISRIESLKSVDGLMDMMENRNRKGGDSGDNFFRMIFPPNI